MIELLNPAYQFNIKGTVCKRTTENSEGQHVESYHMILGDLWMKRLAPPRGNENEEAFQAVGIQRDSFLTHNLREHTHEITRNDLIIVDGLGYFITGIRPYKSSNNYIVFDTEFRDNQRRYETDESGIVLITELDEPIERI